MHQQLPREINPFRLANNGLLLEGTLPVASMSRLCDALTYEAGEVDVKLQFDVDEMGTAFVSGEFKAELSLICERCMQAMRYPVDTKFLLALIRHEDKVEYLAEQYEPLIIESDEPITLSEIVEDELILALPIVPKHEHSCLSEEMWQSSEETGVNEEKAASPFAVLSVLKTKD